MFMFMYMGNGIWMFKIINNTYCSWKVIVELGRKIGFNLASTLCLLTLFFYLSLSFALITTRKLNYISKYAYIRPSLYMWVLVRYRPFSVEQIVLPSICFMYIPFIKLGKIFRNVKMNIYKDEITHRGKELWEEHSAYQDGNDELGLRSSTNQSNKNLRIFYRFPQFRSSLCSSFLTLNQNAKQIHSIDCGQKRWSRCKTSTVLNSSAPFLSLSLSIING